VESATSAPPLCRRRGILAADVMHENINIGMLVGCL
jgi:hypothetical protein